MGLLYYSVQSNVGLNTENHDELLVMLMFGWYMDAFVAALFSDHYVFTTLITIAACTT